MRGLAFCLVLAFAGGAEAQEEGTEPEKGFLAGLNEGLSVVDREFGEWVVGPLATVLFLVGVSTQFPVRAARFGLIGVGIVILIFSIVQLILLPKPPL